MQRRSDGLVTAFADGTITLQQLQDGQSRLDRQRRALQARLPVPENPLVRRILASTDVRGLWESLDIDERREVIDDLLEIRVVATGTKEATYLDWRKRILNPQSLILTWKSRA